jgi:hypothetical protein
LTLPLLILGLPKSSQSPSNISLPKKIRQNLEAYHAGRRTLHHLSPVTRKAAKRNSDDLRAKEVARKLQDGCISGAIRVLTNDEVVIPPSIEIIQGLLEKHPQNPPIDAPRPSQSAHTPPITSAELVAAIKSFPNGSASGPDGFRPQHLKELLSASEEATNLLSSLAAVGNLMLHGDVPPAIRPTLYGANLHAFRKKDGGLRPIAVGITLRRLIAKIVSTRSRFLNTKLNPIQLGFATKGGSEAAIHAARSFVEHNVTSPVTKAFLKLDIKNAFNSLDRNKVLEAASRDMPQHYGFIWQCYSQPTHLLYGDQVIPSQCGVQQGDPLGPLLYCLATIDFHRNLHSTLIECYLDDDVIGGDPESVLADAIHIRDEAAKSGLILNVSKCELVLLGGTEDDRSSVLEKFLSVFPDILRTPVESLCYLGAPLTTEATPKVLEKASCTAMTLCSRLKILPSHQSVFLLKNCLGPVKLLYILRTSRAYKFPNLLCKFDEAIRVSLCDICNIDITPSMWQQASLPVTLGGLGIRRTEALALPAFIASVHSVHTTTSEIIPYSLEEYLETTMADWCNLAGSPPPEFLDRGSQKAWDLPLSKRTFSTIFNLSSSDPNNAARLLSVSTRESGAWLQALPAASIGNLLDDASLRIAIALRLGATVTVPHKCICSSMVDSRGYHGLSCRYSAGRLSRHAGLNHIIKRALNSAGIPSQLEPAGISRSDGKRPDGVTLIPWSFGKCLCWDATVVCTMAPSHIAGSIAQAGSAASSAESKKASKYRALTPNFLFKPLGFETLGSWGPEAKEFVQAVGARIYQISGEPQSTSYLTQRISLEIQRGNAASVLGTTVQKENLNMLFNFPRRK